MIAPQMIAPQMIAPQMIIAWQTVSCQAVEDPVLSLALILTQKLANTALQLVHPVVFFQAWVARYH
jgi:hypothetical protein